MARKTTVSKYLARIGRKGGKASGKARMEKLTPEQRVAVAKTAAAARWAKPVTQEDLKQQSALQVAEWTADRAAQMGAEGVIGGPAQQVLQHLGLPAFLADLELDLAAQRGHGGGQVADPGDRLLLAGQRAPAHSRRGGGLGASDREPGRHTGAGVDRG